MRLKYICFVAFLFCFSLVCGCGSSSITNGIAGIDNSYTFTIQNAASGMSLGISGKSQNAGASIVQNAAGTATSDMFWHAIPMNSYEYNLENMLTHQLMGVSSASTSAGASVMQYADNGTADHLWRFYLLSDGNYLIQNVNSGLYLEDVDSSTSTSATIAQGSRSSMETGCTCQEWSITMTKNAAYPGPQNNTIAYSSIYSDTQSIGIHDPTMIKAGDNYYLYSTHGELHAHASTDRTTFTDKGFALISVPSWANTYNGSDNDLWAPDISYHSNSSNPYWLYYASSIYGSTTSAIGIAYSQTGAPGSFTDYGSAIYTSSRCSGSNAIDPSSVVDTSKNSWMVFGSWSHGIFVVPVDSSTGIPSSTTKCKRLAYHSSGSGIEGAYIYQHDGYYYLFMSADTCCAGTSSTYRIIVGRSSTVNGTYLDRGGVALTSGGGTILLSAHGNIIGPGGQSVFSDTDGDILVYHYYDGNNNGYPALGINVLGWTSDDWPYIAK